MGRAASGNFSRYLLLFHSCNVASSNRRRCRLFLVIIEASRLHLLSHSDRWARALSLLSFGSPCLKKSRKERTTPRGRQLHRMRLSSHPLAVLPFFFFSQQGSRGLTSASQVFLFFKGGSHGEETSVEKSDNGPGPEAGGRYHFLSYLCCLFRHR